MLDFHGGIFQDRKGPPPNPMGYSLTEPPSLNSQLPRLGDLGT